MASKFSIVSGHVEDLRLTSKNPPSPLNLDRLPYILLFYRAVLPPIPHDYIEEQLRRSARAARCRVSSSKVFGNLFQSDIRKGLANYAESSSSDTSPPPPTSAVSLPSGSKSHKNARIRAHVLPLLSLFSSTLRYGDFWRCSALV